MVAQLINVNAAGKIRKIDGGGRIDIRQIHYLAAQEIIDLDRIAFFVTLLEIEGDHRGSRVGVKPQNGCLDIEWRICIGTRRLCLQNTVANQGY